MAATHAGPAGAAPQQPWVGVVVHDGFAVLSMAKEPVNSMDLRLWQELEQALNKLEADPSVRVSKVLRGRCAWCGAVQGPLDEPDPEWPAAAPLTAAQAARRWPEA